MKSDIFKPLNEINQLKAINRLKAYKAYSDAEKLKLTITEIAIKLIKNKEGG